jgi:hypothetical protein
MYIIEAPKTSDTYAAAALHVVESDRTGVDAFYRILTNGTLGAMALGEVEMHAGADMLELLARTRTARHNAGIIGIDEQLAPIVRQVMGASPDLYLEHRMRMVAVAEARKPQDDADDFLRRLTKIDMCRRAVQSILWLDVDGRAITWNGDGQAGLAVQEHSPNDPDTYHSDYASMGATHFVMRLPLYRQGGVPVVQGNLGPEYGLLTDTLQFTPMTQE